LVVPLEGHVRNGRARPVIEARGLGKRLGDRRVLDGIDFALPRGGFLLVTGPNGAGKTTLLRLCAGLAAPTHGHLAVEAARAEVGYVGHDPLVYLQLTPLENLELFGRLFRVPERRERSGMLLERFGLWRYRSERCGALSRGLLQRLALARALLHAPSLLVLDEPYAALDREGAELLDGEINELRADGTFLVATHQPERLVSLASAELPLAA
jgi:ABC-type multidrug transport system ATPase subunit